MSDFDFFGTASPAEEEEIKNELELSFEFDYENLLNDGIQKNVKLCASIRPSDDLRRNFEKHGSDQCTHICLVIDTSDSMRIGVDFSNAVATGRTEIGEDGKEYKILRGGISKLNIAVASAKRVVDLMREGDTLSCVSYDDRARIVFYNKTAKDRDEILMKLHDLQNHVGMNTNISEALMQAKAVFSMYHDSMPKRVIFFTDGTPTGEDTEEKGIYAGKALADNYITVDSMGFGKDDVNFPYLQKISSFSGGITTLISYPDEFASVFASMFEQSQSIVVTNVKLVLKLTPGTRIYDYYRGTPDNVYLGNRGGVNEQLFEINLGQIEKNQMYKYYFNIMLPGIGNDYEGPINTMSAELHYYVPGKHNDSEQIIKTNVPVNYTSDMNEIAQINGNINVLFRLAEVKRFDEEREKAFAAGDADKTIYWISKIIDVYTELQKPVETQAYTDMLKQFMATKKITNAVLNKAASSSSQAQETGILDELDSQEKSKFADRLKNRRRH